MTPKGGHLKLRGTHVYIVPHPSYLLTHTSEVDEGLKNHTALKWIIENIINITEFLQTE